IDRLSYRRLDVVHRIMKCAIVSHQLDHLRAVKNVLVDGLAELVGSIRIDVFELPEASLLRRDVVELPAERPDDLARGDHGRPMEPLLLDALRHGDIAIITVVA